MFGKQSSLNRPTTLNAFTGDNIKQMQELLDAAAQDRKVIVLTGSGDINWEKGDSSGKSGLEDLNFTFNRQIVECPKPAIARVNGSSGSAVITGWARAAAMVDSTVVVNASRVRFIRVG